MHALINKFAYGIAPRLLPKSALRPLQVRAEKLALAAMPRQTADASALRIAHDTKPEEWLGVNRDAEWSALYAKVGADRFHPRHGAVNPGDQRALYFMARALRPRSVLEVGTHVGASTGMLALALRQNGVEAPGPAARITTVDILDVNDPVRGAWREVGASQPPRDYMSTLGCSDLVTFVAQRSVDFLKSCREKFDLIFLDGNHLATTVYEEVPAALSLLNPGGVILLHDYFPDARPLWNDGEVIPGPELAVLRLREENVPVMVKPLSALPWPTKNDSNVSSLAVLCRSVS